MAETLVRGNIYQTVGRQDSVAAGASHPVGPHVVVTLEIDELYAAFGQHEIPLCGLGLVASQMMSGSYQPRDGDRSLDLTGPGIVAVGDNRLGTPKECSAVLLDVTDPYKAACSEQAESGIYRRAFPQVLSGVGGVGLQTSRGGEEDDASIYHQQAAALGSLGCGAPDPLAVAKIQAHNLFAVVAAEPAVCRRERQHTG